MSGASIRRRLVECMRRQLVVTADDATAGGSDAFDPLHVMGGRQNGIGPLFSELHHAGYLVDSGRMVKTIAPKGKGRKITVWEVSSAGQQWAGTPAAERWIDR